MKNQFLKGFKTFIAIAIMVMYASMADAQVAITDDAGGATADPTAVLDLQSTTKGFLLPRMTDVQRIAIPSPAIGLQVQNDVTGTIHVYTINGWSEVASNDALSIDNLTDAKSNTVTSYYIGSSSGLNAGNTASNNTAIGSFSGSQIITGQKNTAIGAETGPTTSGLTHTTTLGYNTKATANHQVVLGTLAETVIIPNKIHITPQDWSGGNYPGGTTGDLYVDSDNNGLYYHDGTSWKLINKQGSYAIGDIAFGGVIGYLDETGEHGFVVSQVDVAAPVAWAPVSAAPPTHNNTTMAGGNGLWAGEMNTAIITGTSNFINNGNFAAHFCSVYTSQIGGGPLYGDWYLPSTWELQRMYDNRVTLGLGSSKTYWASTDHGLNSVGNAFSLDFSTGTPTSEAKTVLNSVRAVRRF